MDVVEELPADDWLVCGFVAPGGEGPGFGVVRAISDWTDEKKTDGWHGAAAAAAAAFCRALVESLPPVRQDRPQPQRRGSSLATDAPSLNRKGWGKLKMELCKRMSAHEALDLADCCEIDQSEQDLFQDGRECQGVWAWLERRALLSEYATFIAECIERPDLAHLCDAYFSSE